jgi:hypothetical protein
MTGYKISAGTGILFYVRHLRPGQPGPLHQRRPLQKAGLLYVRSYRITTFFSITVAIMQRHESTPTPLPRGVRQNPEILFF